MDGLKKLLCCAKSDLLIYGRRVVGPRMTNIGQHKIQVHPKRPKILYSPSTACLRCWRYMKDAATVGSYDILEQLRTDVPHIHLCGFL